MLLEALSGGGDRVTSAIQAASRTTGTAFDYLLQTAVRESALDPRAKAATSSARGLYQFIESTWLETLKEEGPRFGLARQAAAIERTGGGGYVVRDPRVRAEILKLRENPEVAALMAGALAARNAVELSNALGRSPTSGELYTAHFLGAGGAKRLLSLAYAKPDTPAAAAFPEAARANKPIFFRRDGSPRSAKEVYGVLTARHDRAPAPTVKVPPVAVAEERVAPAESVAPARPAASARVIFEHPINPGVSAFAAEDGPAFQTLFRNEGAGAPTQSPLSAAVRELWGGLEPAWSRAAPADARQDAAVGDPLDLQQFLKPSVRRGAISG